MTYLSYWYWYRYSSEIKYDMTVLQYTVENGGVVYGNVCTPKKCFHSDKYDISDERTASMPFGYLDRHPKVKKIKSPLSQRHCACNRNTWLFKREGFSLTKALRLATKGPLI